MTIVRVGATKKYSDGWETAFGKGKKQSAPAAGKTASKKAAKKSTKSARAKKAKSKKRGK